MFTPKYRKKVLFGQIRRHLNTVFHDLAQRKECRIEEGHLMPDHVHMLISIPPKYSVSVAEVITAVCTTRSSLTVSQRSVSKRLEGRVAHQLSREPPAAQPMRVLRILSSSLPTPGLSTSRACDHAKPPVT